MFPEHFEWRIFFKTNFQILLAAISLIPIRNCLENCCENWKQGAWAPSLIHWTIDSFQQTWAVESIRWRKIAKRISSKYERSLLLKKLTSLCPSIVTYTSFSTCLPIFFLVRILVFNDVPIYWPLPIGLSHVYPSLFE